MSTKATFLTDELYQYLQSVSVKEIPVLQELREVTAKLPNSIMQIAPEQGQFMALLTKLLGVKKALEIGVFTGYSSISVALAMPEDGKLIACDVNEEWTNIAREFWHKAGVAHKIELHLTKALDYLDELIAGNQAGTFDLIFIDADKANYYAYYEKSLTLLRTGGLILVDNTLWDGAVADPSSNNESTRNMREFNQKLFSDNRILLSLLPVGDGLTLAYKK